MAVAHIALLFVDPCPMSIDTQRVLVNAIIGRPLSASVGLDMAELTKPCAIELLPPLFEAHYKTLVNEHRAIVGVGKIVLYLITLPNTCFIRYRISRS